MQSRGKTTLSAKVERTLATYATAAGAAGVGMLTMVQPAEGRIIYTPAHVVINLGDTYNLDLNQDGMADFILKNKLRCNTDQCFWDLVEKCPHGNAAIGSKRFSHLILFVSALSKGAEIGPRNRFYNGVGLLATAYYGGGGFTSGGEWANVTKRYMGLKFKINDKVLYGWARLNVTVTNNPIAVTGTLTGFAYQTVPNKPIVAGDTGRGAKNLGHLALGAAGR